MNGCKVLNPSMNELPGNIRDPFMLRVGMYTILLAPPRLSGRGQWRG